jgi:hypothetical protein
MVDGILHRLIPLVQQKIPFLPSKTFTYVVDAPFTLFALGLFDAVEMRNGLVRLVGAGNEELVAGAVNLVTRFRNTPQRQQFLDALPTSVDRFFDLPENAVPLPPLDLGRPVGNEIEIPEGGGDSRGEVSAQTNKVLPRNERHDNFALADPQINQGTLKLAGVADECSIGWHISGDASSSLGNGVNDVLRRRTPPA